MGVSLLKVPLFDGFKGHEIANQPKYPQQPGNSWNPPAPNHLSKPIDQIHSFQLGRKERHTGISKPAWLQVPSHRNDTRSWNSRPLHHGSNKLTAFCTPATKHDHHLPPPPQKKGNNKLQHLQTQHNTTQHNTTQHNTTHRHTDTQTHTYTRPTTVPAFARPADTTRGRLPGLGSSRKL